MMMEWENGILSTAFELELVTRTSIKYLATQKKKKKREGKMRRKHSEKTWVAARMRAYTWTASAFLVLAHELAGRNPTE